MPYLQMLIACLIWGVAGIVIKLTLGHIDPIPFLVYRFFISFCISIPSLWILRNKLPKSLKTIAMLAIYGLFVNTISLGFLFFGLKYTTVLTLTFISLIGPLVAEFSGVVFLHEKTSTKEKVGTIIALAGALVTVFEPLLNNPDHQLSGNILLLLSLVADVIALLIMKKLLQKRVDPNYLTHFSFFIGFITLIPLALVLSTPQQIVGQITSLSGPFHIAVLYMGLFSGTIAYTLRAKALKKMHVTKSAIFGYLAPIFTSILAIFILHESLTPAYMVGAAIIILGVIIAET